LFFDGADVHEWAARLESPPNRPCRPAFDGRRFGGRSSRKTVRVAVIFQMRRRDVLGCDWGALLF
jgi:hypothetical protein